MRSIKRRFACFSIEFVLSVFLLGSWNPCVADDYLKEFLTNACDAGSMLFPQMQMVRKAYIHYFEKNPTSRISSISLNYVSPAKPFELMSVSSIPEVIDSAEEYKVVIDPGHGGIYEPAGATTGDHWDEFSRRFLLHYNSGAQCEGLSEQEWTLELAQKISHILDLTKTSEGFVKFIEILKKYASPGKIKRVAVNCELTRYFGYTNDPQKNEPNSNRYYRLFDSPWSFSPQTDTASNPTKAFGRISRINHLAPDLVICIHNNSNNDKTVRGFTSVVVPHFDFFSRIQAIVTNKGKLSDAKSIKLSAGKNTQIRKIIIDTFSKMTRENLNKVIADTFTYFTGVRAFSNKFIGFRFLMVSWPYNTESFLSSMILFFLRENSINELFRRAGGIEGFGGDNFYASQELLRFVRFGLWKDYASDPASFLKIMGLKQKSAGGGKSDEIIGRLGDPFISDWAIPLFVNAVTAYIEVGYISNAQDRALLKKKQDLMAEAVAVGIYSLFAGLPIKSNAEIEAPKGIPLDLKKYSGKSIFPSYLRRNLPAIPIFGGVLNVLTHPGG